MYKIIFAALAVALTEASSLRPHARALFPSNGSCNMVKITPSNLVSKMFGPLMRKSRNQRPAMWRKSGLPKSQWGIWWTTYNKNVETGLYNSPARNSGGGLSSVFKLGNANVWTNPAKQIRLNRRSGFNYNFIFSKTGGSRDYNFCRIKPSGNIKAPWDKGAGKELIAKLPSFVKSKIPRATTMNFVMEPVTNCAKCSAPSGSFFSLPKPSVTVLGYGNALMMSNPNCQDFTTAGGNTVRGDEQCWRRYSSWSSNSNVNFGNSEFTYDVVKIVDEYGDKIQPNFNNWAEAMESSTQEVDLCS